MSIGWFLRLGDWNRFGVEYGDSTELARDADIVRSTLVGPPGETLANISRWTKVDEEGEVGEDGM